MKNRTFWILVIGTGLVGWNVAKAQTEPDLDYALLTSEAAAVDGLHVMDADGRNLRPFVSHPEYTAHGSPAWSCDGSKLAFDAWRSGRGETYVAAHIFTCHADGSQPRDIGMGAMPSWSPDGNRIVFSNYNPRGVWIMNADGADRQLLNADGWGAEWCPRGDMIAYTVSAAGANIAVLNLATNATITLLDDRYATVYWGMAWSPDGNWIAFKGETQSGSTELAVVHVEGHKQGFRVLLPAAIPDMTDLLHNPSWSPGGTQILAAVITKANPARQLYLLDVAGNEPAKLLPGLEPDRWYNDMAWSPDGTRIVVSTRQTAAEPTVSSQSTPLEQPASPRPSNYPRIVPAMPAQPTVTPAADLLPSDARELVSRYEQEKAAIKTAAAGQVRERRQQLIEELKPLQDKYTREARLDEAVAIRDLIRALTPPAVSILPDSGSLSRYNSRVGDVFYLCVTGRLRGSVWGTDVYTSDSTLATAAVHAGVLHPGQTGMVKVTILPGQAAYQGATRNSVRSVSYGPYPASYKVESAFGEDSEYFYAPKETDAQATSTGGAQDPEIAQLRGLGAKLVARGARGSWSPDGKRIAVGKMPFGSGIAVVEVTGVASGSPSPTSGTRPIFVLNSEVGSVRDLMADGKDPTWSPDGRWIAFTREVGSGAGTTEEIWLTAADRVVRGKPAAGSQRRLGAGVMATWSADATTVFFSNPQTREIFSVRADQPNANPAVMWKAVGDQFPDLWYPVVAPNGRYVAYHADGQLKIADMADQRIVGSWPLDGWRGFLGGWSPDGSRLGFGAFGGEDKGLWELPFTLAENLVVAQPRPIGSGSCTLPSWSSDGSKMAFDFRAPERGYEVWTVDTQRLSAASRSATSEGTRPNVRVYQLRYAQAHEHLNIREVEQAIAKLLHDVNLAQDKAREARAAHQQAENDYKAATGEAKVAALLQALRLEIAAQREGLALGKVSKEFQAACRAYQNALDTEQIITADPGGEKQDDIPPSTSLSEERLAVLTVYHLKYGSAEAIAKELTSLFAGRENCTFAADSAQNALIVHGTQDQQEQVEQAIRSLDVPTEREP